MEKNSKLILTFISFIFLWSCANQIAPSGGEVDKIPPEVLETYPQNRAINFNDNHFDIKFSEYVDRLSVQNAIFISPSLKYGFEYNWSGKTLHLEFRDTLQQNTTYTITIGTDIVDLNNRNKLALPYTFTFSTGSKIDTAKISGKVYADSPSGIFIYAFKNKNDFNPETDKPNYISQVGNDGRFKLNGLSEGDYKIFALKDKSQDMFYNPNEDEFGIQSKKITIDSLNQIYDNLNIFLTKEDTISPRLSSAFMKDRNHILVEFNESIDSSKINSDNFYLFDSLSNKKINVNYFYKYDAKPKQFYIALGDSSSFQNYFLVAENIYDLCGNKTAEDKIQFLFKNEKDTLLIKPIKVFGEYENGKVDYEDPKVKIQFNDGIFLDEVNSRIKIEDNKKNNLIFSLNKIDDALFEIKLNNKLKQATDYYLFFDAKNLKNYSEKAIDTTYKFTFTTNSELEFTGASGKIIDDDSTTLIVNLKSVNNKKNYIKKIDKNKYFNFEKVTPDKYLLWAFKDKNKNDKYDFGKIKPFEYSEEFYFYPDTLNLRARWPVGDIDFNIKNK